MKRLLLAAICLLTLGIRTCSADPVSDDVLSRVQKQVDQCVVLVTMTLKWNEFNKDQSYKYKNIGVIISPEGAVMLQGKCDARLAWSQVSDPQKTTFTGQPFIQMADGRSIEYRLKAYDPAAYLSILVPAEPIGPLPYIDISQPCHLPLGLHVLSVIRSEESKDYVVNQKAVSGVFGKSVPYDIYNPMHLVFSALTGQFIAWSGQETSSGVSVWTLDDRLWNFISSNTGVRVKPVVDIKEPVDPIYQRVYDANKNSMGTLRYESEENRYENTDYYALTPSGDVLVIMPSKMLEKASRPGSQPAKATLTNGTKCQMRWKKIEKGGNMAVLSPVAPLKKPLTPITWQVDELPQVGETVYGCMPSNVNSGVVDGHDPSYPDRIVVGSVASGILFNSDGRAAALMMQSDVNASYTFAYNGASTAVKRLQNLMPGIQLSMAKDKRRQTSPSAVARIPHNIRNWGFLDSEKEPFGDVICSAVCIDGSGYFVLPHTGWFDDNKTTHPAADTSPQQMRSNFLSTEFDSAIVDDQGQIGAIATVFTSERLGLSIGKLRKLPIRPMKAIDLTDCQPVTPGEKLYGVDASMADGKMMQVFTSHTALQPAEYPFTGTIDRNDDQGALCYSLDGQPRGYITLTDPSKASSPLMLVDLAEIAKKLALVKEALGDR